MTSYGVAEAFKQNRLRLNRVLAEELFKRELAKRLSNALSHCNGKRDQGDPRLMVAISSPWAVYRGGHILFSCLKHWQPRAWSQELSGLRTVMNYSMGSGRNVRTIQIMQKLEAWFGTECSGQMVAINYSLALVMISSLWALCRGGQILVFSCLKHLRPRDWSQELSRLQSLMIHPMPSGRNVGTIPIMQ